MTPYHKHAPRRLRLCVSSCLLGEKVRYDGGDRREPCITDELSRSCELIAICPEVAIGLGVPRPPVRLEQRDGRVEALGIDDPGFDITERLCAYAQQQIPRLAGIDGYIFKGRSPSCGVNSTPLFCNGVETGRGAGLFAAAIMQALPLLPIIEETALRDAARRADFLERARAYQQLREPAS